MECFSNQKSAGNAQEWLSESPKTQLCETSNRKNWNKRSYDDNHGCQNDILQRSRLRLSKS